MPCLEPNQKLKRCLEEGKVKVEVEVEVDLGRML
jgi:hypothetical protein